MAQDIFIELAGIKGKSTDATHPGEIEVLSWDWTVGQQADMHAGSGGGAGKCSVGDLSFEHYIDRATPNLVQYCLEGKHLDHAVLVVRKAGGTPLEYFRIALGDVLIKQVQEVHHHNMRGPRERVDLSFSRFTQEYVIQSAQGGRAGTVRAGYDVKANKAI